MYLNKSYTDFIKFISCIFIYILHYYADSDFFFIVEPLAYIGCSIFFFLSVYGISKSQEKKKLRFLPFIKYRILKIWLPLLFVNCIFIGFNWYLAGNTFGIPHYAPNHKLYFSQETITNILLYLLDFKTIDPVTWFLHTLIISYILIWGLFKIEDKKKRLLIAICIYLLTEAFFFIEIKPKWFKIDTIGLFIGVLYATFQNEINGFLNKYNSIFLKISLSIFIFTLGVSYLYTIGKVNVYFIFIVLAIIYSSFSIMIMLLLSKNRLFNTKVSGILGGISFMIYLTHVKIINITDHYNFVLCFFCILIVSLFFYKFSNKIVNYFVK